MFKRYKPWYGGYTELKKSDTWAIQAHATLITFTCLDTF